jgi:Tol biopolymer transport system component
MRLHITITVTLCLLLGYDLSGQTRSPEAQLKAAQHKEQVEGDLKGAIEQYKQLIARPGIARGIAAEALLGLAQSYEKLGVAEARAVYEQIIRDYTDQGAIAAAARERVSMLGASASRAFVARQLLQLPSNIAVLTLMSDGRIGSTDWETGDLVLVDPASGAISRVVQGDFEKGDTWAEDPLLSPDRRQLAYQWFGPDRQGGVLRVLSMERGAKSRTLVADPATARNIHPIAWRKDATAILVCYERPGSPGGTSPAGRGDFQLAWVTVADGAIKPIRTFEWWRSGIGSLNSIGTVSLSPDGGWIAYAVPDRQGAPDRSIFVIRTDGSGERRVMSGGVNDQPIWTPDGSRLVFLSNRSGDFGLWSLVVSDSGENSLTLIKNGMGRVLLHGVLASGGLVYSEAGLDPLIVAEFDRPLASKTTSSLRALETLNGLVPAWSPDGRYLAYKRRTTNPARPLEMVVQTLETGELRTYSPRSGVMGAGRPTWYPDGTVQAIARSGVRLKVGGTALEELSVPATLRMGYVSPDGRTLYDATPDAVEIFDASTGTRTGSFPLPKNWRPAAISPDGRSLALVNLDNESPVRLGVIGVDGSGFRQLSAVANRLMLGEDPRGSVGWTRDGSALVVRVSTAKDVSAIQRVPIAGGQPVTIAANIVGLRSFDISADERRIAYSTDRPTTDVWVLDLKAALK